MKVSIKVIEGPADIFRVIQNGDAYTYEPLYTAQPTGSVCEPALDGAFGIEVRPHVAVVETGAAE